MGNTKQEETGQSVINILDLFSGIGGFSLGLERSNSLFKTKAFCDIDKHAIKVLNKHWPNVPILENITTVNKKTFNETIDLICGGFPCQDISNAGKREGLQGKRSGLWFEFHRLIDEYRPKWIIAENVAALRTRGLEQVLHSLHEIGYDAEWHCISASSLGAPHERDRIWIVAYPYGTFSEGRSLSSRIHQEHAYFSSQNRWKTEPSLDRVANGVPGQAHRLKQLGNSLIPLIPELLGKAIIAEIHHNG